MQAAPKPVVLIVLDGFGISLQTRGNPIMDAKKPNLDRIEQFYPFTTLQASATAVGLPWGEAGNSEVGHLTMGAGRVIYHHLPRIVVSIQDGSFYKNPAFLGVIEHVRKNRSALHLFGLVSSGSVHSYIDHVYALFELAKREEITTVFLHAITDGKDAPPREGKIFFRNLLDRIAAAYPFVRIASLVGRFYAMDRDEKWERIRAAYDLLTSGVGKPFADPVAYLEASYAADLSDEAIEPAYLASADGTAVGRIRPGDGLIIFNFREDSVREITMALAKESFDAFPRARVPDLRIATMTEYAKNIPEVRAAFEPLEVTWPLARVISAAGKTQLHIAESEKYAHVTYFFNGGGEKPFAGEDRILVPSLAVPHFDERPDMRARDIASEIFARIDAYDFILGNLANADMVGHTGNYSAVTATVEVVDAVIGELEAAILDRGGVLLVTGDHGNAEQKTNPMTGEVLTEHTTNPVPFYLIGTAYRRNEPRSEDRIREKKKETGGILIDVAPTVIELMKLQKPEEMSGKSLLPLLLTPD